ncbi:MAG: hypothetical protein ACRDY7_02790 [Acidimicrobiia bacterium]
MFKRLRWMLLGMGLGAWGKRRLARLMQQYTPPRVASRAAASAKDELRAAVTEGRAAMRAREAELRAGGSGDYR